MGMLILTSTEAFYYRPEYMPDINLLVIDSVREKDPVRSQVAQYLPAVQQDDGLIASDTADFKLIYRQSYCSRSVATKRSLMC